MVLSRDSFVSLTEADCITLPRLPIFSINNSTKISMVDIRDEPFQLVYNRETTMGFFRKGSRNEPIDGDLRCLSIIEYMNLYDRGIDDEQFHDGSPLTARERGRRRHEMRPPDFILDENGHIMADSSGKEQLINYEHNVDILYED